MANNQIRVHSFTLKAPGIAQCLHSPLEIAVPRKEFDFTNATKFNTRGIWDTGATSTVITKNVVDALNLKPTGQTYVNTASQSNLLVDTYLIDLFLSNSLRISGVQVTVGVITDGVDCLIGMDVISLGDFSITNFNKKTTMSFRIPSLHEVDYMTQKNASNSPVTAMYKVGRNDPCPCGSGKKYKKCCGK